MGIYFKIVLSSLLLVIVQHMARFIYILGFHKHIYNHEPGPCKYLDGVDFGSEDIATLSDGKAFITSGLMIPAATATYRQMYADKGVKGQIFLFDFKAPGSGLTPLTIQGDFNASDFFPHGIDYWQDKASGKVYIFVVNHRKKLDAVEKFEFIPSAKSLKHVHSYVDQAMHFINDVAVTGENSFYFTNFLNSRSHFWGSLEMYMMLPLGSISYFDGNYYETVEEGCFVPNGLALTLDKKYLYMATSVNGAIKVFKRQLKAGQLTFLQEVKLYTSLDNPTINPLTGHLLVGAQPIVHTTLQTMGDPSKPSASQVLHFEVNDGILYKTTELYTNDGSVLSSSTVASLYGNQMLIGTICHKLLHCEVRTL
ncbi:serum paraoxonase/lactonase 3-like isoform X1 [Mizuhopecten yessoensis]|uniref:serum paraoxonase/lactonase 3-like isoform X1 n=1 Tax=Mizuhopecten yessoensis TaxID=6573 RepID=UPI000B45F0BE|nr:serum paraoxonase/lactonase 3-like isoform X1 [Mizuhopecten yessoensis]